MVSDEDRIAQHYARWEKRNSKASGLRRRGEEEKARRAAERARQQGKPEEPIVLDGGGVLDTSALPDVPTPEEMDAFIGESHVIYYDGTPDF